MVELGLYAVARVYWTVFSIPLHSSEQAVRVLFLIVGSLTAIVGGIECFGQRHLKRLLAFSTISHVGVMILGFALLDPSALAGAAIYVLGHGTIKAALFICAGILLHRFETVDEFELQGRCGRMPWTGMAMFLGALALAGLPTFGTFFGAAKIEESLERQNLSWLCIIIALSGLLTGAAVLRVAARAFLGWGERDHASGGEGGPKIAMDRETHGHPAETPVTMFLPAVILLAFSLVLALSGSVREWIETMALRMTDAQGYRELVLHGNSVALAAIAHSSREFPSYWRELVTSGLAIFLALPPCIQPRWAEAAV